MPTYQYACTTCGHQLEAVQSFTDEPLTECPACEGRLRKLFNSVGIVFKGSGFYRTDSRNGDSTAEKSSSEKSESSASSSTASSSSSSSNSTPGGASGAASGAASSAASGTAKAAAAPAAA